MKNTLTNWLAGGIMGLALIFGAQSANAQQLLTENPRKAFVLAVQGEATYELNGKTEPLRAGLSLAQGAVIKTSKDSKVDLFLRQVGSSVRLQPDSELRLVKLEKFLKDGLVAKRTLLHIEKGSMLCYWKVLIPHSQIFISTPLTETSLPGVGTGRFEIDAGGIVTVGKKSLRPLAVTTLATNVTVLPGQSFNITNSTTRPIDAKKMTQLLHDLDELQDIADELVNQ
jgi:hypothetical protein